jgi:hypothetical protein
MGTSILGCVSAQIGWINSLGEPLSSFFLSPAFDLQMMQSYSFLWSILHLSQTK